MDSIIAEFVTVSAFMAIQALFISKMLELKRPAIFIAVFAMAATGVHIIGAQFWAESAVLLKVLMVFLSKLMVLRIFFSGRWRTVIFVSLIVAVAETCSEFIMLMFLTIVLSPQELLDISSNASWILLRIIVLPLFACFHYLPYFIWTKTISKQSDTSFNAFIVFLLSQVLTLCISGILIYYSGYVSTTIYALIIVIVIVCGIADLFVFRAIRKMTQASELEKSYLMSEYQLSIQTEYYNHLIGNMEYTNKLRHDFRNQLQAAYALFAKGDESSAIKHLSEFETMLDNTDMAYCGNLIIDAIMVDKAALCGKFQIELETDLNVGNDIGIENVDLCSVVANIMDNAIKACENIENAEKRISLKAYTKAGWLVITETNSAEKPVEKPGETKFLPKHGLGLSIIRDISEKYDGKCEVRHDDNSFTITVWLSCTTGSKGKNSSYEGASDNVESCSM